MTLNEALSTGKRFARSLDASTGDYYNANEYLEGGITVEDYNATDYEVEPDVALAAVPRDVLAAAWNESKGSSTAIAVAEQSAFFKRFTERLAAKNITVVG